MSESRKRPTIFCDPAVVENAHQLTTVTGSAFDERGSSVMDKTVLESIKRRDPLSCRGKGASSLAFC